MPSPEPEEAKRAILRLSQPAFPEFRFEWHPLARRVYFIKTHERTAHAFAFDVENEGAARNAVYIFLRGYREALKKPPIQPVEAEGKA